MSVRTGIDAARLSAAGARPGADTREWCATARVVLVGYDKAAGLFADVQQLPNGGNVTARIGSMFVGVDAGSTCPYKEGDEVVMVCPLGDPNYGWVIIAKVWNEQVPPPADFQAVGGDEDDLTTDVVTRLETGQKMRVLTKDGAIELTGEGTGAVTIETKGTGNVTLKSAAQVLVQAPEVLIGPSPGGQPIVRFGDLVSVVIPPLVAVVPGAPPVFAPVVSALNSIPPAPIPAPIAATGQVVSAFAPVKAG